MPAPTPPHHPLITHTHTQHRPSVIDEWNIPYDDIRIMDLLSKGPVVEVYKGYWHGEVAIKKFILPDATPDQIAKFKEEVSILKKTRHENLALFMGASLTPPNLAIVTRYVCMWLCLFNCTITLSLCTWSLFNNNYDSAWEKKGPLWANARLCAQFCICICTICNLYH